MDQKLYYRQMSYQDKDLMQGLCNECFPLEYPESWFDGLLREDRYTYTLGAYEIETGTMVGMIVGQIQSIRQIENEYGFVLEEASPNDCVMYITIFGVSERYRCKGVGSYLMQSLINYSITETNCNLIYLHVEAVNSTAITFYQRRGFTYHCTDVGYYMLPGDTTQSDGLVLIQFINNGRPYKKSFDNWCKRSISGNPIMQCLGGVVKGPFSSIRHIWHRSMSSPS
ncbi:PREDICTED: N-alpha-acetyltransferase 60-like [Amphimedon queenslandica]|uniref:N-alpha-acetyltransferase 60 n=1 Tax=Amphimedon queenslandica TaxID=400682 RepID=A0A1X7VP89_AMPQE|nr:PREDICTED: N-alpha-acetyltransferase 60-like [Amphimedon queenslandica]|eukprot:XP_003383412.1 PREDICTED: N-alpha-acetyltransferase 60-like [Amphimedon queenslandica]